MFSKYVYIFSTLFIKKVLGDRSVGVQYDHFIKAFSLGIQVFPSRYSSKNEFK